MRRTISKRRPSEAEWRASRVAAEAQLTNEQRWALSSARALRWYDELERKREFNEDDVNRDERGRFSSGGSAGGGLNGVSGGVGGGVESVAPGQRRHPGSGYSKDAWEDPKGVIHTSNVNDAQLALFEDRKVSLDQGRTLSTLMDKLADIAQDAEAKGEKAPLVDLCNVSVKGSNLFCADHKDIPRIEMPQLDKEQTQGLIQKLKDEGYKTEKTTELASYLRATQNQLIGPKVASMMRRLEGDAKGREREVIVDRNNYVLDGHHHWAAMVGVQAKEGSLDAGTKMNITRIDIDIIDLLQHAHEYTGGKGRVGFKAFLFPYRKQQRPQCSCGA